MTNRTTMMFDIDISTIDINPLQIDTPFGRAGTIARGDLFAERDAIAARVQELEARVQELESHCDSLGGGYGAEDRMHGLARRVYSRVNDLSRRGKELPPPPKETA